MSSNRKFIEKTKPAIPLCIITLKGTHECFVPTDEAKAIVAWDLVNFDEAVAYIKEVASMDISSDGKWYELLLRYMKREKDRGMDHVPVKIIHTSKGVANRIQRGVGLDELADNDWSITYTFPEFDDEEFSGCTRDLKYILKAPGNPVYN